MAVKLELYRVFKEVAETGNISAAAKNLYISQSAVSQSVKQLETALQARLFARSPRGVTLTGEGQMLYQYVRNALGLLATGGESYLLAAFPIYFTGGAWWVAYTAAGLAPPLLAYAVWVRLKKAVRRGYAVIPGRNL